MTDYFHASLFADLQPGDVLLPSSETGMHQRPRHLHDGWELFPDGEQHHDSEFVWLATDADEAEEWATDWGMKATAQDIKTLPMAGCVVYRVEPIGPILRRVEPHSPNEYAAKSARIIERARFTPMDFHEWLYEDECPKCHGTLAKGACPDCGYGG